MLDEMKKLDSRTLASYIVAYRYLKINKQRAIFAIQILELRIENGEDFDYNKYCNDEIAKLPVLTSIEKLLKASESSQMGSIAAMLKKLL